MLENDYQQSFASLMNSSECEVALPSQFQDMFARRGVVEPVYDERRRFVRRHFATRAVLELAQTIPTIVRAQKFCGVFTTDMSRSGIAFLHAEQLFPGEQLWLWLPTSKLPCRVARCRRHNSKCFEVGATFCRTC